MTNRNMDIFIYAVFPAIKQEQQYKPLALRHNLKENNAMDMNLVSSRRW